MASKTARTIDPPAVVHAGASITLPGDPAPMTIATAIDWLQKIQREEEQTIVVRETIDVYPWDGARAFAFAIRERFGFAQAKGSAFNPPANITIDVDVDTRESIPWGGFVVPGIDGVVYTGTSRNNDGRLIFSVSAEVKKKHAPIVRDLVDLTRTILSTESIYRGKAIKFRCDDDGEEMPPEFIDLFRVNPSELVYTTDTADQVDVTVFAPLRRRQWCKELGIPFKRGVCLLGMYGVGKTLAVYVAAQHAKHNGITSIIVEDAQYLPKAMLVARQYAPSLVVVEDIDRVTRERDDLCNDIMDALDGVEAKESDVMVLFTSNNADHIHEAMRRPGRIDTFIKIDPPDALAVEKLLRLYGRGRIAGSEDIREVCAMLAGQIPAVVREVVERAKLAAVARAETIEDATSLTGNDLRVATRRLLMQQGLFTPKTIDTDTAATSMAAFGKHVVAPAIAELQKSKTIRLN
jgi:transitional endoplasmic reticulum ATPase